MVGRHAVALAHGGAALLDGRPLLAFVFRPMDRDRIRLDQRGVALVRDQRMLVLDAGLQEAIHRFDEVLAVIAGLEPHDGTTQQPFEDFGFPRADTERFGVGPGDVPEGDDRRLRQAFADQRRQQREVVVLHQHHRVGRIRLGDHRVGKAFVDFAIALPVGFAENRPHMRDMAQRPQPLVGKAVVVALLFFLGQPDPAQRVAGRLGRHRHMAAPVRGGAVGRAAAVRDPGAGAGPHHRLDRGHQAAGRALDLDPLRGAHVAVGLAVRYHDHFVAQQVVAHQLAQPVRGPMVGGGFAHPALVVEFMQQRAQVAQQRLHLGVVLRERLEQALALEHRAHPLDPAAPAQVGDQHRDQRHHQPHHCEQPDHRLAGIEAAPLDETHVVHQHQFAQPLLVGHDRHRRHMQRPFAQPYQRGRLIRRTFGNPAAQRLRERGGLHAEGAVVFAKCQRKQPLILDRAVEQRTDPGAVLLAEQLDQLVVQRGGDQLRAGVQIAHCPAQGELVDQRHHRIGQQCQRNRQRHHESQ